MALSAGRYLVRPIGYDAEEGKPIYGVICPTGLSGRLMARPDGYNTDESKPIYVVEGCQESRVLVRPIGYDAEEGKPIYGFALDCCEGDGGYYSPPDYYGHVCPSDSPYQQANWPDTLNFEVYFSAELIASGTLVYSEAEAAWLGTFQMVEGCDIDIKFACPVADAGEGESSYVTESNAGKVLEVTSPSSHNSTTTWGDLVNNPPNSFDPLYAEVLMPNVFDSSCSPDPGVTGYEIVITE